ncbi:MULTISPECIES: hypothetical protein [unclassified Variovorax]|uniref:hypothetical protein n=1 Tax=unclassified Variovorax TaxID=663243 RepID=UPI001316E82A|nr:MULTISPECIES: hypothetical protein [unclassified Variovorax]VTU42410.1 hypothetical protein SRS16P1_00263 [Variovorax sp. SRS16]VTU42438.1 hypothetical protein E5P1_00261 [Variovorax sp. PBL-E5]VTU44085.1 hypothetical protein H6P1_00668 [Variovorax sp. PBL-H6]
MTVTVHNLEGDDPLAPIGHLRQRPQFILAVRLFDHIKDPAKLLAEIGQRYEPGRSASMLVVTSNLRYFRKTGHPPDFGEQPQVGGLTECRDGQQRFLRSRTEMRRLFRDAGFLIYDEASPLLPAGAQDLDGFTWREGDHAVAPFHVWLLGIHSTRREPANATQIEKWLSELTSERDAHGTAHLLLEAIKENLDGVHWRTIPADSPLIYKHNTGGQVFIVRTGRLGAYMPGTEPGAVRRVAKSKGTAAEAELPQPPAPPPPPRQPRVVLDPNEAFGELEIFDHETEHDRRFVSSVYGMPLDRRVPLSDVLVLPQETVQILMKLPKVLGNPMLVDLRTKSLESSLRYEAPYVGTSKLSFQIAGAPHPRVVEPVNVSMVASLLALALEADREKALYALDGRRVIYIDRIHEAPSRLFQRFPGRDVRAAINGALEYLQAAGVLGLMRPVPLMATPKEREERYARLREVAKERNVHSALATIEKSAPASAAVFERFLKNPFYCLIIVEADMSLRKFVLEPTEELFTDTNASIVAKGKPSPESLAFWHDEMVKVSMDFWRTRIEADAWWYDSLGTPLAVGRQTAPHHEPLVSSTPEPMR